MLENAESSHTRWGLGYKVNSSSDTKRPIGTSSDFYASEAKRVGTPSSPFSSPSPNPAAADVSANHDLALAKEALKAMNQELEITRLELQVAKRQIKLISSGKTALSSTEEIVGFKRRMALELLGKEVLEKYVQPASTLEKTIAFYLKGVEKIYQSMLCLCTQLVGNQLLSVAAPSLPAAFCQALNGLAISANAGSGGTAAFQKQPVIAMDIEHDARWVSYKWLALSQGIRAGWSFPLMRANHEVLGTLDVYFSEVKAPSAEEEAALGSIVSVLQLIMENKMAEKALRESNERYHLATEATNDAIYDWDIPAQRISWGVGFEKIFGVPRTTENSTLAFWESKLHPQDHHLVIQTLMGALQDGSKDHWQAEYRFIKANGTLGYISERGYIVRNEEKVAVRMVGALQDITERKMAEEELLKFSVIAKESINGVLILSPDLTVQWVNQAFTNIMGYTLEEVHGTMPGFFAYGEETDLATLTYMEEQLKKKEPLECELLQLTKAGNRCWLRLQVQPLLAKNGEIESFFAFLMDITQQKEEEQQLRLLESVVTNAQEAITISKVHPAGAGQAMETIFCNKAYAELTGYSFDEVVGHRPLLLNGPQTEAATLVALEKAMAAATEFDAELVGYRKTGDTFWGHLSLIPVFNRQHQLTHWISMLRDITARKGYAQEREQLITELTQHNANLKQFSFITSHNLRSPLSNLKGLVNLLDMDAVPEGRNKLLINKFAESTVQLSNMVDDLLEILIIKTNEQIDKEMVSLADAFAKVKDSVDELLAASDATVETDFSEVPAVAFHPGYLHSILLNLLTNAIKYRSKERPLRISLKSTKVNGRPVLHFSDNGLGIDMNRYRDRVFGLYQRFHQNKDSKGMGLYIAQSQANSMGGQLLVESEVNKGTTFTLQFES